MRSATAVWSSVLAVLLALSFGACVPTEKGDYFFLESRGAVMPVWVRGAPDSGRFVLFLHGGPGRSAIKLAADGALRPLESERAVVYWDQRGAGSSQGGASAESLTLEQYTRDARKLLDLLEHRYRIETLHLVSHDFGAAIAVRLLQDGELRERVDSLVFVSGLYDVPRSIELSRNWIEKRVEPGDASGGGTKLGQSNFETPSQWYSDHSKIDEGEEYRTHRDFLAAQNAFQKKAKIPSDFTGRVFRSPAGGIATEGNRVHSQKIFWGRKKSLKIDLTRELGAVDVPTLVLWGEADGVTPPKMGEEAVEALGTPDSDRDLVVFEDSAHRPHLEENGRFNDAVLDFIDTVEKRGSTR